MTLTVVVPNYNKESYLSQCIESIENQSMVPDEVIIVDDCSTDGSRGVISSLEGQFDNIRTVFKPHNSGVSSTRNAGLALVRTDYVTFIDADDFYYDRDKLKNEMALEESHGGDIVAYSVTAVLSGNGTVLKSRIEPGRYYLSGNVRFALLTMWKWKSVMRDYIVRTDALRNTGGYDESRSLYEDWELLLVLSRDHDFFCTGRFGTGYREGNGLSSGTALQHEQARKEIFYEEIQNDSAIFRMTVCIIRGILKMIRSVKDAVRKAVR